MKEAMQAACDIRCEWGERGLAELAADSDVIVIVDVLSFSTCVDVATARGAMIFPFGWKDAASREFAEAHGALLAGSRKEPGFSLSPASLLAIPPRTRLVLPSVNGSELSLAVGTTPTFAGCLRNAAAVASAATKVGRRVAVIPAGERWPDRSLRPALEDWLGAGAIVDGLGGSLSPESQAARDAYRSTTGRLKELLEQCTSAQELIARGYVSDVRLASELNVSRCVPRLVSGAYVDVSERPASVPKPDE